MTDHRTEASIGIICMIAHVLWRFFLHLSEHFDFYQIIADGITTLLFGFMGAFGAWLWSKILKQFKGEAKDK